MQIQSTTNVAPAQYSRGSGTEGVQQAAPARSEAPRKVESQSNQEPPVSRAELDSATKKIQDFVDTVRGDIQFSLDDDSGKAIVKVIDKQTKDILMQFPSKDAIEISKSLEKLQGILIKQQA